jgi:hypothetical protein
MEASKPFRALGGAGAVGKSRIKWVYERGIPELIQAYESRQISLHRADIVAHLTPENQCEELKKLVVGKEKVTLLPATEDLLLRAQREQQVNAEIIALDGLNEFQRAFRKEWLRLGRKYGKEYSEGELWRLAETVIIRLTAPDPKVASN